MNAVKQKILLLLLGGIAFGCSYTAGKQWRVLKEVSREWKRINKNELRKEINNLYKIKIISKKENKNGSVSIELTEKGKLRALNYQLENLRAKHKKWDGKWRMVAFDIPERSRRGRDALRDKLKSIGFCELQKSVFVFPYDCEKEITFLVDLFKLKQYIRFGVLESIDNRDYLKKVFKLS